jgi:hypothetical protein
VARYSFPSVHFALRFPVILVAVILAAGLGLSCATTSQATCKRVETCVRRCQDAGTPAQNQFPFTSQYSSLSACDRRCGTCSAVSLALPGADLPHSPEPPPTYTGSDPTAALR